MEEVDGIILVSLRQVGCNIAPAVRSIKEFSVEDIVESVAKGLKAIDPSRDYPARLPQEMSSRYRVCTTLANACKDLGYRGELAYNQFLYPNEGDTRKLLMWVVEMLPKTDRKEEGEVLGSAVLFQRAAVSETSDRLKQAWLPPQVLGNGLYQSATGTQSWHYRSARAFFNPHTVDLVVPRGAGNLTTPVSKELRRYWESTAAFVTAQAPLKRDTTISLFEQEQTELVKAQEWEAEWNKNGLKSGMSKEEFRLRKRQRMHGKMSEQVKSAYARAVKEQADILDQMMAANAGKGYSISSRFQQQAKLAEESAVAAETEEELQQRRAAELQALRDKLAELTLATNNLEKDMQSYETNIKQLESKLQEAQIETKELEAAYKWKKRAFDLLDDPDRNIAMLKEKIDESSTRMLELATQWEQRRKPLIQAYRELKDMRANKMAESMGKLEKIKEFRQISKTLAEEARERNELYKQLVEEYERLPKDVQRPQYTDRIMEIVKNVKKQNVEIDKVLQDTRQLQKEISGLVATLSRSYTATEELVFRDAKINEFSKRAYKLLVSIHEMCGDLIKLVEETGQMRKAVRDLEDKIDQLNAEKTSQNLQKITDDLEQVTKENNELVMNIKRAQMGVL